MNPTSTLALMGALASGPDMPVSFMTEAPAPKTPPKLLGRVKVTDSGRAQHNAAIVDASKKLAERAKWLVFAGDIKGAEKIKRRIERKAAGFRT